jgi:hypothetical protein
MYSSCVGLFMVELPVDVRKMDSALIAVGYVFFFLTVKGYVQCSQVIFDFFK